MADEKEQPRVGAAPPSLTTGYNQTYIVRKRTREAAEAKFASKLDEDDDSKGGDREVFFRCGNWCYSGSVYLGHEDITLRDMPRIIPLLQRQQNKLSYTCNAQRVPSSSSYNAPMTHMAAATEYVAQQICSDSTVADLDRWAKVFPWIEDETQPSYFELVMAEVPPALRNVSAMASKTYARGLVLITLYFEGAYFLVVKDGTGDQPLLDVRFPDVSQHGQGLSITLDPELLEAAAVENGADLFTKLTLWQSLGQDIRPLMPMKRNPNEVYDISSNKYMQTYCVLHDDTGKVTAAGEPAMRKAMFRFGSWCYSGQVQLVNKLSLGDIPHVIPALRAQQSRLQFQCDVSQMPRDNVYTPPLAKMVQLFNLLTELVLDAEEVLSALLERMGSMGLADTLSSWLNGDSGQSFFEFSFSREGDTERAFRDVELITSKVYDARGFIFILILYQDALYLVMTEGVAEQPLLDSNFPDVSKKGRGYQIRAFPEGHDDWPELRKVSIWQTTEAMKADMETAMAKAEELRATLGDDLADGAKSAEEKRAHLTEVEFQRAEGKYVDSPRASRDLGTGPELEAGAEAGPDAAAGAKAPAAKATAKPVALAKPSAKAGLKPLSHGGSNKIALPHHLPADDGLASKLAEIRRRMGDESGDAAPWDRSGRPLGFPGDKKL
mmetsp:Transcript_44255/g.138927  ORF Transcript_44255/g.138927 Transcript_44255/m.138927 type:complete len:665 (-) Transcript_44255:1385-3379(-)